MLENSFCYKNGDICKTDGDICQNNGDFDPITLMQMTIKLSSRTSDFDSKRSIVNLYYFFYLGMGLQ